MRTQEQNKEQDLGQFQKCIHLTQLLPWLNGHLFSTFVYQAQLPVSKEVNKMHLHSQKPHLGIGSVLTSAYGVQVLMPGTEGKEQGALITSSVQLFILPSSSISSY